MISCGGENRGVGTERCSHEETRHWREGGVGRDHFRVDAALWVDVLVIGAPGKASINHLDGTDLYQSVAIFGVNAGGFRI